MRIHLNELRRRRGMTWRELSERTGFSHASLTRWNNGRSKSIRFDQIDALCTALGVQDMNELLEPEIVPLPWRKTEDGGDD